MKDSNVKVGDKVKSLVNYAYVNKGEICRVVRVSENSVGVESSRGFTPDIGWCLSNDQYEKIEQTSIEQLLTKANKHAKKAAKHEQKRLALIEQAKELLPEGYELNVLGEVVEATPAEDMNDPNNWQVGDVVKVLWLENGDPFNVDQEVTIVTNHIIGAKRCAGGGSEWSMLDDQLKWISRPNKETN